MFGLGIVLLATLAAFHGVLGNGFVSWDVPANLTENPFFHPVTWESLGRFWRAPFEDLYIPLPYTLWAALVAVFGGEGPEAAWSPVPFHTLNVVLHLANVALVWAILGRLLQDVDVGKRAPAGALGQIAGTALFALHPLQVEPVAWTIGLRDVLAGFFSLTALVTWLELDARGREPKGAGRGVALALVTSVAFVAALLSKPSAMVLPAVLALMTAWRSSFDVGDTLRRGKLPLGLGVVAVGWAGFTASLHSPQIDASSGLLAPLWARPFIALDAFAFYAWKLAWPLDLAIVYGRTPLRVLESGAVFLTSGALLAAVVWMATQRGARPAFLGIAVAAIFLAPYLGLVTFLFQAHSTTADRYAYLAILGPALVVGHGLRAVPPAAARIFVATGMIVLGGLTIRQVGVWHDSKTLYVHSLSVFRDSPSVHYNLAQIFLAEGDETRATEHYHRTVELLPSHMKARTNLGVLLLKIGRADAAIGHFRRALRSSGGDPVVAYNLASALRETREYDEARQLFESLWPHRDRLPNLEHQVWLAIEQADRVDEALADYRTRLDAEAGDERARRLLAFGLYRKAQRLMEAGNVPEGGAHLARAVRLVGGDTDAFALR